MYTSYESRQYTVQSIRRRRVAKLSRRRAHSSERFASLPEPVFKPTKLLRVSDMKVVRGSSITGGYCALSYSWNWSGDMIRNASGEYDRVDNGLHKIIHYQEKAKKERRPRGRDKRRHLTKITQYVKFEGIIQKICKDFNIEYIWYDQMCINQSDREEKKREIKQMHLVYRHAYCTIVLIPEMFHTYRRRGARDDFRVDSQGRIYSSEWLKRAWTLEEAALSRELLFIGRNVHIHSRIIADPSSEEYTSYSYLHDICRRPLQWNASNMLAHIRGRTSSKLHDIIFALANMVPSVMKEISFGYDQSLQDLAVKFFSHLAMEDLTILCFGKSDDDNPSKILGEEAGVSLPSWTGNDGEHFTRTSDANVATNFSNYTITDGIMRVTTQCISVAVENDPQMSYKDAVTLDLCEIELDIEVELPVRVEVAGHSRILTFVPFFQTLFTFIGPSPGEFELTITHMLPLVPNDRHWVNGSSSSSSEAVGGFLSVTDQSSGECVILYEIQFNFPGEPNWSIYPVVRQEKDHYKAIGICTLFNQLEFSDAVVTEPRDIYIK